MTIAITGSNGQVGSELQFLAAQYPATLFLFTNRFTLDICNAQQVNSFFATQKIDALINCAAYTAVDKAESETEKAFAINELGAKNLAEATALHRAKFIHLSTDFVFDGSKRTPYREDDPTNPLSVYGASKLAGENTVLLANEQAIILRTAWVYSTFGNNFVKTMLRLSKERPQLNIVADQLGTPTYARDLADVILKLLHNPDAKTARGIFHYTNEGETTWYDFARAIGELAPFSTPVLPISTSDFPTPAKRPAYSVLDKSKIKNTLEISIPYWRNSLAKCLDLML